MFRGLQRKFATIIFASVVLFLVYLLLSNSGHLQTTSRSRPDPQGVLVHQGQSSVLHDLQPDRGSVVHMDNKVLDSRTTTKLPVDRHLGDTKLGDKIVVKDKVDIGVGKDSYDNNDIRDYANKDAVDEHKEHQKIIDKQRQTPGPKPTVPLPPLATNLQDPYSGPRNREQQEIVSAFLHAWKYYKLYAWGHDELKPVSKGWQEWMGVGLTIVDSLDTMYIMGLTNEFSEARDWVATSLTFDKDHDVQLFEIVIRELGGLMSAYHLSGDKVFLDKALDLGEKLSPCFNGASSIPCNRINLKRARPHFMEISTAESGTIQLEFRDLARAANQDKFEVDLGNKLSKCFTGLTPIPCFRINLNTGMTTFGDISTAEVGTVQLEFTGLGRASGNSSYEKAAAAVSDHLHTLKKLDGLVPCFLNAHTGEFRASSTVSMGASADSYYEYLIKQWIQTGRTKDWMRDDYLEAVQGMKTHLYKHTARDRLGFVGSLSSMTSQSFRPDMEHLACFLPGMLALGYMSGVGGEDHLQMAQNLTYTCYQMYARSPTGLSPEVASMGITGNSKEDIYMSTSYSFNLQRPEAIESIFYMWRATRDPKYRRWGWEIFQAFEKYTKLETGGYASISNVKNPDNPGYRDKMETFYLAETLKYLYLLFSDDPGLIPLDKFVINTEAHPLPVYGS